MLDEYLIHHAKTGDKQALDKLIRRYYDKIYAYCFHHVGNKQTAEDLCQETFCNVIKHLEDYNHYGKFQNYLYVIARNQCMDFFKKKKPIYLEELPEPESWKPGFEQEVIMKELVAALPEELKAVVILRFYQELKYQDIAKVLNLSVSLVKYRVSKAVTTLHSVWEVAEDEST